MSSPAIEVWPHAHALLIGMRSGEPETVDKSTYKQGTPETKKSGVLFLWLLKLTITLLLSRFLFCVIVDLLIKQHRLFDKHVLLQFVDGESCTGLFLYRAHFRAHAAEARPLAVALAPSEWRGGQLRCCLCVLKWV